VNQKTTNMLIERFSNIFMKRNENFFGLSKKINYIVKINKKYQSSLVVPLVRKNYFNELNGKVLPDKPLKYEYKLAINLSGFIKHHSTSSSTSNSNDTSKPKELFELNVEHHKNGFSILFF
jgi:hypothetical protein